MYKGSHFGFQEAPKLFKKQYSFGLGTVEEVCVNKEG